MKEITLVKLSVLCLLIQTTIANVTLNESIDFLGDHISIVSFIIIVVANWSKVVIQVKKWFK
jgi:hypothetical protein